MIHRFSVRSATPEPDVERRGRGLGLPDLELWLDYYIEFEEPLTAADAAAVCRALADQPGTAAAVDEPFPPGTVTVLHRRGVVDNESPSIVSMCELLGLRARAGKVARCYRSSSPRLREIIEATAFNSAIEELHDRPPQLPTLVPAGVYLPADRHDLRGLPADELAGLGQADGRNLMPHQMRRIRDIQELSLIHI